MNPNKILPESSIQSLIMLAIQRVSGVKIFRNNTAMGWSGQKTGDRTNAAGDRVIELTNPRPIHAGLHKGSSDLIGWRTVTITPDMVGKQVAIFTAIEVKTTRGRATPEQIIFIDVVKSGGGISGIATSPDEAIKMLMNV